MSPCPRLALSTRTCLRLSCRARRRSSLLQPCSSPDSGSCSFSVASGDIALALPFPRAVRAGVCGSRSESSPCWSASTSIGHSGSRVRVWRSRAAARRSVVTTRDAEVRLSSRLCGVGGRPEVFTCAGGDWSREDTEDAIGVDAATGTKLLPAST